ncbi:MAG: nitroreductase [Variovorax sp.]|nr:nitroreductase [Variovorax sp.]
MPPRDVGVIDGDLVSLLAARHQVSARRLVEPGPGPADLEQLMAAAVTAPDHGQLTPWHFVLIPASQRLPLGKAFVSALIERDPGATQAQIRAAAEKAERAPCLLLAVLHGEDLARDVSGIPTQERLISLGCAIQNVLLAATSLGYSSGLASGRSLNAPAMRSLFALQPHEQAICFIAIGTESQFKPPRQRPVPKAVLRVLGD